MLHHLLSTLHLHHFLPSTCKRSPLLWLYMWTNLYRKSFSGISSANLTPSIAFLERRSQNFCSHSLR